MYTRGEESSVCEYVKVRGKEMEGGVCEYVKEEGKDTQA